MRSERGSARTSRTPEILVPRFRISIFYPLIFWFNVTGCTAPMSQWNTVKAMTKTFEAVYENGVLHPVDQLSLPDRSRVTVTISDAVSLEGDASAYFSSEEWDRAKSDSVSLEDVRRALSSIEGSLSDAVIASRGQR
jgi:predicted DNA-binding antitoxin AbrB/MazE fold protein